MPVIKRTKKPLMTDNQKRRQRKKKLFRKLAEQASKNNDANGGKNKQKAPGCADTDKSPTGQTGRGKTLDEPGDKRLAHQQNKILGLALDGKWNVPDAAKNLAVETLCEYLEECRRIGLPATELANPIIANLVKMDANDARREATEKAVDQPQTPVNVNVLINAPVEERRNRIAAIAARLGVDGGAVEISEKSASADNS